MNNNQATEETRTKVQDSRGNNYMLLSNEDTILKSRIWGEGVWIYEMMQQQQPERFNQMKANGTIVDFINEKWEHYDKEMTLLVGETIEPTKIAMCREIAWPHLVEACGLNL